MFIFLKSNQSAGGSFLVDVNIPIGEAAQHPQLDLVFAGKFNRTNLQHFGAHGGHLQHFFKANAFQTPCFGHHAGVGGVHAVHIGEDQALGGFHGGRHRHSRGV